MNNKEERQHFKNCVTTSKTPHGNTGPNITMTEKFLSFHGKEKLSVPAGTFKTDYFQLSWDSDVVGYDVAVSLGASQPINEHKRLIPMGAKEKAKGSYSWAHWLSWSANCTPHVVAHRRQREIRTRADSVFWTQWGAQRASH